MLDLKKSILYFLLGCIPIRIIIAIIPTIINPIYLPYYGILLLIQAISFFVLYFGHFRLYADEAGGKTWWSELRLIHGLLYLCASIYAMQKKVIAWIPLTIDIIVGLAFFIYHHTVNNDFTKLTSYGK